MAKNKVDVEPIRNAVLEYVEQGNTWASICIRLGWSRRDVNRLQRSVGKMLIQTEDRYNKKYCYYAKTMDRDKAIAIVEAINMDPVELSL